MSNPPSSGAGQPSLFGSAGQPSTLFGAIGNSSSTTAANPFPSGQSLFGQSKPEGNQASPSTLTTPNKPGTSGQAPTLFGTTPNTTQTPKASFTFGNPSTTPAGPPPTQASTSTLFGGQTLFAGAKPADKPSSSTTPPLFGAPQASSAPNTSLFGSSSSTPTATTTLFGTNQQSGPKPDSQNQSKTQAQSLFGNIAPAQSSSPKPFGSQGPSQSSATLFGAVQPSATTQQTATSTKSSSDLFGSGGTASGTQPGNTQPSLFGKPTETKSSGDNALKPAETTAPAAGNSSTAPTSLFPAVGSAPAAQSSTALFAGLGQPKAGSANPAEKDSATSSTSLFGNMSSKPSDSSTQPEKKLFAPTTTQPASTSSSSGVPSLLASKPALNGKDAASSHPDATSAVKPTNASAQKATPQLASSTAGPAPTPQSRLKNKSMDDIVTRWATDLAKYQKEFQKQAEKVAEWDNILVKNANTISQLYSKTFQAERDTAEVQKQLSAVEESQDELDSWLTRYEREVDDIMARQVGQGEGMSGPDQERERTYKTAERVSERLTEMSGDLTNMIEEINASTAAMSKTTKADDPLSQIVRVLNGHLQQLQQIDQDTAALQTRVTAVQHESRSLGGRNGFPSSSDDFYRSAMGSR